jgi:phosphatidylethanolamine/phosphatidyl-N-methylethanolamine N-methyltransferase
MVHAAGPALTGRVLELGAGTGVFTRALLRSGVSPDRLTLVEFDPVFAARLRRRFPGVRVLEADVFSPQTIEAVGQYDAILSGLPLLNFAPEQAVGLIRELLARASAGASFIQFTYGRRAPVPPPSGVETCRIGRVWRNLPPATVWAYRLRS